MRGRSFLKRKISPPHPFSKNETRDIKKHIVRSTIESKTSLS